MEIKIGDRFHYPEDELGITVDYVLKRITINQGIETYTFKPLEKTYIWKGKVYSFGLFVLKYSDIMNLLNKGKWIKL